MNHLLFLSAELFLSLHYFYLPPSVNGRKQGILQAYALARNLIAEFSNANKRSSCYDYLPGHLFRILFTAACIIWMVLNSNYCVDVDFHSGRASFNHAVAGLRQCSVANNDNAARQSEILVHLWRGTEGDNDGAVMKCNEPRVTCRSRYSASLAYGCLFYWRDRIGGQSANGLHQSTTSKFLSKSRL